MPEKTIIHVEGMTCSNCAQNITRQLAKKGLRNVQVNFEDSEVVFDSQTMLNSTEVISAINNLGYKATAGEEKIPLVKSFSLEKKFLICAVLTILLLLHMVINRDWLHNPFVQLMLCLPVMIIGWIYFGKSAYGSLKNKMPNMDVLITIGSGSAFIYSLVALVIFYDNEELQHHLYFETSATIITLVLLGNLIEKRSLKKTTNAIEQLMRLKPQKAMRIINALTDEESIVETDASKLKINDLVLVSSGERISADGRIYRGSAAIDESSMTGEAIPVDKKGNDVVLAGTLIVSGSIKMICDKTGDDTVLNKIIEQVKQSTLRKPAIQRMGDKVSAWFVPAVIIISIITFCISFGIAHLSFQQSLLHSIAVMVISCPCAMGLATPTAVAVGIGKAAAMGILVKGGDTAETFSRTKTIVFDKTGTLTTGKFKITKVNYHHADKDFIHHIIQKLEQQSKHPIAVALVQQLKPEKKYNADFFKTIEEQKGFGVHATDADGNIYKVGSFNSVKGFCSDVSHRVYVSCNSELLATIDMEDEIRQDAKSVINYFRAQNIKPVLLSGDNAVNCKRVADALNIDDVYADKLPHEKAAIIRALKKDGWVAMVGDGVNDAVSLAEADTGISFRSATEIAIQSAAIVLMNEHDLFSLCRAHQLTQSTLKTIKQNLFWALAYNVIAIPAAAFGMLSPMISSLSMTFSDVVVIGNSLRLKISRK